ncbi:hypothetical protein [Marinobacter nauticus]
MGRPKSISRVFLAYKGDHYAFYWVSVGSDRSIYFGSSIANWFKWGFNDKVDLPAEGARIAPDVYGREMNEKELSAKHSLHSSGVALLPTRVGTKRDEYRINAMEEYPEHLPLVGVLPMPIHRYRKSEKKIRAEDIVLDVEGFAGFPFAVLLYAHREAASVPEVVKGIPQRYPNFVSNSANLNADLKITAVAYNDSERFSFWRCDEYVVSARPSLDSLESIWPLFAAT